MAKPIQNRKPPGADESVQKNAPKHDPPGKKTKKRRKTKVEPSYSLKSYPKTQGAISHIHLTRENLKELDRRQRSGYPLTPSLAPFDRRGTIRHLGYTVTLARFANHGGPDLCNLRGYQKPASKRVVSSVTSSNRSWGSWKMRDRPRTLETRRTKRISAYDHTFEQNLTDNGIYATYSSQPPDVTSIRIALTAKRLSLSLSNFSDGAFNDFQDRDARAKNEVDVSVNVIPIILSQISANHPAARDVAFNNLDPIMDDPTVPAQPDIYYGAHPEELGKSARNNLSGHIMPSTRWDMPLAPNFFLEMKGPDGSAGVVRRQVRYNGAIGSRAIHSLQNFKEEEPTYDGKPYTFSSSYLDGQLKLYAHHVTAPVTPEKRPKYHMTQLGAFAMTNSRESFVQGATVFRNARDLAKRYRDNFIQQANARASGMGSVAQQQDAETSFNNDGEAGSDNDSEASSYNDSEASSYNDGEASSYNDNDNDSEASFDNDSEASFDNDREASPDNDGEAPAAPYHSHTEGDSKKGAQEPAGPGDPSRHSKRSRQSLSPHSSSNRSRKAKSRSRMNAARRAEESSTLGGTSRPRKGKREVK